MTASNIASFIVVVKEAAESGRHEYGVFDGPTVLPMATTQSSVLWRSSNSDNCWTSIFFRQKKPLNTLNPLNSHQDSIQSGGSQTLTHASRHAARFGTNHRLSRTSVGKCLSVGCYGSWLGTLIANNPRLASVAHSATDDAAAIVRSVAVLFYPTPQYSGVGPAVLSGNFL